MKHFYWSTQKLVFFLTKTQDFSIGFCNVVENKVCDLQKLLILTRFFYLL